MSNSKVRKWIWKFKDVRTIVHNEEGSGLPSVITDDLKQAFETKIPENRVLDHAPYSLDLTLSDFHLLWYLKLSLGGKRLSDNEGKATVNSWLSNQAGDFFVKRDFKT
ncbi:UNVERIFIED_CONTAM: hypothetical protein NCL1_18637 [Trichonephila clavipes]